MAKNMTNWRQFAGYVLVFGLTIYAVLLSGVTVSPLTQDEVKQTMAEVEKQNQYTRHDLSELRAFLEQDDGQAFYTVNLYQFHDEANYVDSTEFSGSGTDAYGRFSSVMIKLMLGNFSFPIFGSEWLGLSDNEWDRMVIVRYRSRRDILNVFIDDRFVDANQHKWAAIKKHERFVVQAKHLPELHWVIFIVLSLVFGCMVYRCTRRKEV